MDQEKKEFGSWWVWVLVLSAISIVVLGALSAAGVFTGTIIERKVFENSYQRTEGLKARIATYEAQLAEIVGQLARGDLDASTRSGLEAQAAAIRIQLRAAKERLSQ